MFMNAVLWGYIQFRLSEKNTLEVFIIFFEFRNCRTIQMNMLFAAICLLFKSKAGLGGKPKSLRLFTVCVALAEMLSLLLSCFIKVGAKPLAGLGLQNPRIFKIQKKWALRLTLRHTFVFSNKSMQKCRRGKRNRLKIFAGLRTRKTFIKTLKGVLLRASQTVQGKSKDFLRS